MTPTSVPPRWETRPLADLVTPERPITYGIVLPGPEVDDGVPYVRVVDMHGGSVRTATLRKTTREIAAQYRRSELKPGDVLLSIRGHVGRVAVVPDDAAGANLTQDTARIALAGCEPRYVLWALQSAPVQQWMSMRLKGVAVRGINLADVREIPIAVPPLSEQRRIAAILDEADALRRKRRDTLVLLDDLLRATFLDMFGDPVTNPRGWETAKLGDLITDGPTNGLYRPASDYGLGTPIVRIDSFYDGRITDVAALKRVRIDAGTVARYALAPGQVLVNRVNSPEHLGKAAIVPELAEHTVFESNIMRLTLDITRVEPEFVVFQMRSPFVRRQIANRAKDAVNQSSINQEDVRAFELRLPPKPQQHRWAEFLGVQRAELARRAESTVLLECAFASLLHRAFSGSL